MKDDIRQGFYDFFDDLHDGLVSTVRKTLTLRKTRGVTQRGKFTADSLIERRGVGAFMEECKKELKADVSYFVCMALTIRKMRLAKYLTCWCACHYVTAVD